MTPVPSLPTLNRSPLSFLVWLATMLAALGAFLVAVLVHIPAAAAATSSGGSLILALGATLGKLAHDKGISTATIANAGSDLAAALPQVRTDLATVKNFIEGDYKSLQSWLSTDWPNASRAIADVAKRVGTVESKVAALPDVTKLAGVLGALSTAAPAPGAAAPS